MIDTRFPQIFEAEQVYLWVSEYFSFLWFFKKFEVFNEEWTRFNIHILIRMFCSLRGTIYIIYILGKLCFCRLFKNGVKVFDRSPRQATQGGPKQFGFVGESSQQQNHHHYKYLFWRFKYYCSEFASLYFCCFCQIYF